jgi:hypothetical protein
MDYVDRGFGILYDTIKYGKPLVNPYFLNFPAFPSQYIKIIDGELKKTNRPQLFIYRFQSCLVLKLNT